TFQNLLARAIGEPVADVARLAARSEPGDQALGGVARTPTGNFRSQRISRAWSRRWGFCQDFEVLAEHYFELRDELSLHLFQVVGQLDTGGRGKGLHDDDRFALGGRSDRGEREADHEQQAI